MKFDLKISIFFYIFLFFFVLPQSPIEGSSDDKAKEPQPRIFQYPVGSMEGIVVTRFNSKKFRLKLLTASQYKLKQNLSAKEWVEKYNLIAAINAGMYQEDHKTSVGLLINNGYKNNSHLSRDKAVLAFDPLEKGMTKIQIIDRSCQPLGELRKKYNSFLQSIRMITCKQKNTWKKGGKKWPISALAMDKKKDILFIFSVKPQTPHDFINQVLALPLSVYNMMYLEGGPPAQLYLKTRMQVVDLSGDRKHLPQKGSPIRLPIPNVIGVARL